MQNDDNKSEWWDVYIKHGSRIQLERMGRHRVARLFGLDLNAARRLVYYLRLHGPPELDREPTESFEKRTKTKKHLVIGDAHAEPDQDLSRFEWLGRFALDHRPEVIISIGDWFGLTSLLTHGSKIEKEGLRLLDDLKAGNTALQIFDAVIQRYNRVNPDDPYHPRKVVTLGNHDARIMREASEYPALEGVLGVHLMHWEQYGWEVYPFKEPAKIDGIVYAHYFCKPGSGRPVSGMHHAAALVRMGLGQTLVCGHSHQLQWYHKVGYDGRRAHGLVCGAYFDHREDYAGHHANDTWWRGLCLLHLKDNKGDFDLETWDMTRIKAKYGEG